MTAPFSRNHLESSRIWSLIYFSSKLKSF